ncbi:hypothetical protein [Streptomyces sp. NPDC058157]
MSRARLAQTAAALALALAVPLVPGAAAQQASAVQAGTGTAHLSDMIWQ